MVLFVPIEVLWFSSIQSHRHYTLMYFGLHNSKQTLWMVQLWQNGLSSQFWGHLSCQSVVSMLHLIDTSVRSMYNFWLNGNVAAM